MLALLSSFLLLALPTVPFSLALPTSSSSNTSSANESWSIPSVQTHYMLSNPGQTTQCMDISCWPADAQFNSTLSFTVSRTTTNGSSQDVQCSGEWPQTNASTGGDPEIGVWKDCDEEGWMWQFSWFTAGGEWGVSILNSAHASVDDFAYAGSFYTHANNASDPKSYLACIGGMPLDGIRCRMDYLIGMMSVAGPIEVQVERVE